MTLPPIQDDDAPPPREDVVETAQRLYGKYVDGSVPVGATADQYRIASLMCLAQDRYMREHAQVEDLNDILGEEWRYDVLHAIGAVARHPILDLFNTQPLSHPVGAVGYMRPQYKGDVIDALTYVTDENSQVVPEIRMDIKTKAVQADTRGKVTWIPALGDLRKTFGTTAPRETVKLVFDELFWGATRDLLGKCIQEGQAVSIQDEVDNLVQDGINYKHAQRDALESTIDRQMVTMHRTSLRGPANRIVCGPYWARFCRQWSDRAKIVVDDLFPSTKILLMRQGMSILDGPVYWAPFLFTMHPDIQKTDPKEAKDFSKPLVVKRVSVRRREAQLVVSPEQIVTIETGPIEG